MAVYARILRTPGIARIVLALLERHAFAEDADVPDPVPEQPSRA